jgi:hypothetical protein
MLTADALAWRAIFLCADGVGRGAEADGHAIVTDCEVCNGRASGGNGTGYVDGVGKEGGDEEVFLLAIVVDFVALAILVGIKSREREEGGGMAEGDLV